MLDTDTKRRIDTARDILVGKVPDPKSQVEQITITLIYKFMDYMAEHLTPQGRRLPAGNYELRIRNYEMSREDREGRQQSLGRR